MDRVLRWTFLSFPWDLSGVGKNWKDLGRAVSYARKSANLTQAALADLVLERTGEAVSSRTIGTLERGESVSEVTVNRVAQAIGWAPSTPHAILDGITRVGLAGELMPETSVVPVVGRRTGALGRGVGFLAPNLDDLDPSSRLHEGVKAEADAERDLAVAHRELRDLLDEIVYMMDEGEELAFDAREALTRAESAVAAGRYWRQQNEQARREQEAAPGRRRRPLDEDPMKHR